MAIDPTTVFNAVAAPSGTAFLDQYHDVLGALINTSVLRLASVAGTDTITATAEPFEVASTGLVSGMKFTLEPVANNTGAATLNIDGRGAQSIVSGDGSSLNADELVSGTRYLLEFDGTNFVLIGSTGGGGAGASRTTYDTTTVWSNNLAADTIVLVELWGAGGGGDPSTGGGGGGAYARKMYRAGDLPSSVTITVAAGGAVDADGGNSTFGALLTAYGGESGSPDGAGGGGGGGELAAPSLGAGGSVGGGDGGTGASAPGNAGGNARTAYGGAGGGSTSGNGGDAVYGGGGGGGSAGSGGASAYGGSGGDNGSAGQRPGGGGGRNAVGGAGRCIITIFGG